MIYRLHQLKLPVGHTPEAIEAGVRKAFKNTAIDKFRIFRRSIDARDKSTIQLVYEIDVWISGKLKFRIDERKISPVKEYKYILPELGEKVLSNRPVIVGFGPAGMFCAYLLAKAGLRPVVYERGKKAVDRMKDVEELFNTGKLNPESNVLFGEGGAGTFSDGKLNTLIKDKDGRGRFVLKTFTEHGAPEDIMIDAKPHIGTDRLVEVVTSLREEIIKLGGEVRFESHFDGFTTQNGALKSISVNGETVEADVAVLATGHSARDVFSLLNDNDFELQSKAFAMGLRVAHKQEKIGRALYGDFSDKLPPAAYRLTHKCADGRGVYSFCMCPGGYVVDASSEDGGVVVNGMSNSKRDGEYANSAIIVTVDPSDFENAGCGSDALSGVRFQQKYESAAKESGGVPVSLLGKFKADARRNAVNEKHENEYALNNSDMDFGEFHKAGKGRFVSGDLTKCLPDFVTRDIIEGMEAFDRQIKGFNDDDTLLFGVETRTSSPVRIVRGSDFQTKIHGIYPCGEGAGYAAESCRPQSTV